MQSKRWRFISKDVPLLSFRKIWYTGYLQRPPSKTRTRIALARKEKKNVEIFSRHAAIPLRSKIKVTRYLKVCIRRMLDMISEPPDVTLIKILLSLLPMKKPGRNIVSAKRWRHASIVFYFGKKCKIYYNQGLVRKKKTPMKDRISELPDDILIKILENLPMKEAGRTNILAKRWKYVWARVPLLNFDPGYIHGPLMLDEDLWYDVKLPLEKLRYLHWVDQVVSSHKAPTIDEFRLHFELKHCNTSYIDPWVKFCVEKKTKRLELDFGSFEGGSPIFPYNVTTTGLSLCNTLTSLCLAYVNVTGEVLESVICNCRALELLSVTHSQTLVDLKVEGLSLNLKSLELVYCLDIKSLEISTPNLIFFYYFGPKLNLTFKSTPKLAEFYACGPYAKHLMSDFSAFSSTVSRFEVLRLRFPSNTNIMQVFPIFTKLKVLDVTMEPVFVEDLFRFSLLMKACPCLHKAVLQLNYLAFKEIEENERAWEQEASPHDYLKIVEIVGFVGGKTDTRFVKYLLEIVVSLDKIILDPREPLDIREPKFVGTRFQSTKKETVRRARKVAKQVSSNLKPGVDLLIR